jgi:haloacetate dehalogenase
MFEGFKADYFDAGDASVYVRYGGEGPPVLLLHGHPRTSATWHRVAPLSMRCDEAAACFQTRLACLCWFLASWSAR